MFPMWEALLSEPTSHVLELFLRRTRMCVRSQSSSALGSLFSSLSLCSLFIFSADLSRVEESYGVSLDGVWRRRTDQWKCSGSCTIVSGNFFETIVVVFFFPELISVDLTE